MELLAIPVFLVNSCVSSINGFLSSPITGWFPVALIGTLAIAFILALFFVLEPLISKRSDSRAWTRAKLYETFFAFLLVVVFGSFATMLCTLNPVPSYSSVGLIPRACNPIYTPSASGIDNIYGLAECNLYSYNNNMVNFVNYMVAFVSFFISSAPQISVSQTFPGLANLGVSVGFSLEATSIKLFFEGAAGSLGALVLVSQVTLVLLDASMIIFAILLPIGLVSRIFGVTRSFGGAMIAFALGLGFVFPLMVSITYGFLGSAIDSFSPLVSITSGLQSAIGAQGTGGAAQILQGSTLSVLQALQDPLSIFLTPLEYIGIGLVGMLIIPLMTFTIVNTFILDFSQSVGEKMDFFSLLTSVV